MDLEQKTTRWQNEAYVVVSTRRGTQNNYVAVGYYNFNPSIKLQTLRRGNIVRWRQCLTEVDMAAATCEILLDVTHVIGHHEVDNLTYSHVFYYNF